jgi:UDP-2,3-diacylglucosamine pyrophosphatase LpxH
MTPTRNEAWVIRAFLECNGLWADYIIVADQMSIDGTREIIADYIAKSEELKAKSLKLRVKTEERPHRAEVIMIDNKNPEFNEAERQGMLVAKAREVAAGRDTLLWGLDADEILPANWQETEDGKHILNSVKGDVFWFKWAQLAPDKKRYGDSVFYPWLFHDDGVEPHGNYVRNMHSMRIPYPIEEKQMYYVKDFRVLHCGLLDPMRIAAKNRFYQFVDWEMNKRSPIVLSRVYAAHRIENQIVDDQFELEPEAIAFPFDFWSLIELGAEHTWFDDYVYDRLSKYPQKQLRKLDIWDEEFMKYYAIEDRRRRIDKCIHGYLHKTEKRKRHVFVRAIDKALKYLYR